jgi:phosphoribosylcarboxyaminoimidazole (NCAIR) mutase
MLARTRLKAFVATVFASALLAVAAAAPASSQPVVIVPGGLINIVVFDVVEDVNVNVQVPIGVAVNVCGVNAAVLAADFEQDQEVDCSATAEVGDLPVIFQ